MKILFLTQTSELGPASRYRVYQLLPLLRKMGFDCEVSPAMDTELYEQIYLRGDQPSKKWAALRAAWKKRRADLKRVGDFGVVCVQKGVFPGVFSGFERDIAKRKPLVFDFDDAIWLPREGGSRLLRSLHRESSVQAILRCAAAVIAGNDYLADYARRYNRNVTVVPSAIDVSRYSKNHNSDLIGWIGSSTTLAYLQPLKPVFETLGAIPRVIASGDPSVLGFAVEFRPWSLRTEHRELAEIGIGIAPLPDTAWERGKCGVKLLQYMASGIPVVASPVGVHNQMIQHGVNGFLAKDEPEWTSRLSELMKSPQLRAKLGESARTTVQAHYDINHAAEAVGSVLRAACGG